MNISESIKPFVFVSAHGNEVVLIVPHDWHNQLTWKSTKLKIVESFINECVLPNGGLGNGLKGAEQIIDLLNKHPEYKCDFLQVERELSWDLAGGD